MSDCRGCGGALPPPFLDLGRTPLANAFVSPERAALPEPTYPLAVAHCPACHLVQLVETVPAEALFGNYLYFSSYSDTFVAHARAMAVSLIERFGLDPGRRVLEVASNDGYLLRHFQEHGVQVLGVEPAQNVAAVAMERGIPTLNRFFSPEAVDEVLERFGPADVIVGNNVLAHVPAINDFLRAVAACLADHGAAVFEFPSLADLLDGTEFDTIYHEHVFYYSLTAVVGLAARAGLEVFDVGHETVHGGSLRVFLQRPGVRPRAGRVATTLEAERAAGLTAPDRYAAFSHDVTALRSALRRLLTELRARGHRLAAYGAPAKGNTLLNACGIGCDVLEFTVDRSPHKQGLLTPGTRLLVRPPDDLLKEMPDYVLILPWNIADEVVAQQREYVARGGRFVVPVPTPRIL